MFNGSGKICIFDEAYMIILNPYNMIKLRFFIAVIFAYFSFNSLSGQESVNNFYIDGQLIIWQKTFQTSLSFEQLVEQVKDNGILRQIDISPNKIRGELRPVYVDNKR